VDRKERGKQVREASRVAPEDTAPKEASCSLSLSLRAKRKRDQQHRDRDQIIEKLSVRIENHR
jgi:hypothetical protein